MGRTAGRSAAETRRLILDAAARLIRANGLSASLSDIAEAAGVSKGGLLYHFPAKDDLLRGVTNDLVDRFRRNVDAEVDPDEPGPGRLTRAFIRASFADGSDINRVRDLFALAAHLMADPALNEVLQRDGEQWRDDLRADGLDPAVIRLVVAASDGIVSAPLWGAILDEADSRGLEHDLIALTRRDAADPEDRPPDDAER